MFLVVSFFFRGARRIYGSKALAKSPLVARVLGKMQKMLDHGCGGLNAKQFVEFTNDHPALLFPAFQLQRELQKGIVGDLFWLKIAARRGAMARKAAQANRQTGAAAGDDGWLPDPEMDWKEMLDVLRALNDEVEAEDRRRARANGALLPGGKSGARASRTRAHSINHARCAALMKTASEHDASGGTRASGSGGFGGVCGRQGPTFINSEKGAKGAAAA